MVSTEGYCWPSLGDSCGQCHRCTTPELEPMDCSGTEDCDASWHVHGCYGDGGACTEPHEHVIAAESPREKSPK